MSAFRVKGTKIFLPFLLLSIGLLMFYTAFNWLVFIKLELFQVQSIIPEFVLPFGLAALLVLFWFRKRIQLLHLKRKSGDLPTLYTLLAIIGMAVPTLVAQNYLETATGKLTQLDSITQIGKLPPTKYYALKNYYIDKKNIGIFQETTTAGKRNRDLVFTYYITCPIRVSLKSNEDSTSTSGNLTGPLYVLDGEIIASPTPSDGPEKLLAGKLDPEEIASVTVLKDTAAERLYGDRGRKGVVLIASTPRGYLALEYSKTISNNLSREEKEREFEAFTQETKADLEQKNLDQFAFLERLTPTHRDLEAFQISIQKNPQYQHTGLGPLLIAHQEPFAARNGQTLPWVFYSLGISSLVWLLLLAAVPLSTAKKRKPRRKKRWSARYLRKQLTGFLPFEGFQVTPILMYLNVLVFVAMVAAGLGFISFEALDLLSWGANYRPAVQEGDYWRLLTSVFLHGGIMHLFMNMYALLFIGLFLEPLLGRNRYVLLYLICGVAASLASMWWYEAQVSVGASGAIFGLYGFYLALLTTKVFPKDFKTSFLTSIGLFIGFNLLYGLTGGIDNAAHIGGLVTGFVLGYGYYFLYKDSLLPAEGEELMEEDLVEEQEQVSA
ncbi:rhomboid family intramembrane serine protease [Nibribacter ruber]|uniref:Rhomboid family intramembrane serine protease n=1 Tax=Nibribacter ruber TaxID=2698458 RepID=A0A6P1P279_9BACT|nr:rhomboid family intramembrane serine protease [Nibribacter ruber]QHL88491.1 rhomboid family intramembrane serine protease [Nibribacter ruber]